MTQEEIDQVCERIAEKAVACVPLGLECVVMVFDPSDIRRRAWASDATNAHEAAARLRALADHFERKVEAG